MSEPTRTARHLQTLIDTYSNDDFPTWIDQVPRLTRTEVVNDLREILAIENEAAAGYGLVERRDAEWVEAITPLIEAAKAWADTQRATSALLDEITRLRTPATLESGAS